MKYTYIIGETQGEIHEKADPIYVGQFQGKKITDIQYGILQCCYVNTLAEAMQWINKQDILTVDQIQQKSHNERYGISE